jgi:lipopolysaccharide/colanic/teichoic acid biosynthesis glycosyltransferase
MGGRLLDLLLCAPLLPVLVALAPVLWVAGRVGGYESLFFRQKRVGLRGGALTIVKFRTLKDANRVSVVDGLFRALRRVGADELPQVLSIVRGEMACVGPRPLVDSDLAGSDVFGAPLPRDVIELRQSVRPGLTGPAQLFAAARGRSGDLRSTLLELDLWYVRHRSRRLDLALLAHTVLFVLSLGRWAYRPQERIVGSSGAFWKPAGQRSDSVV